MKNLSKLRQWSSRANLLIVGFLVLVQCIARAGDADPNAKYAWAENAGWINFGPTDGSGLVSDFTHFSGFIWSENIGWIKLGSDGGGPYANTSSTDWGVNLKSGNLSGYAWSENVGWISFESSHSQVTVDLNTGVFDGYAWSENVGYIHFKNVTPTYNVRTTKRLLSGTILIVR